MRPASGYREASEYEGLNNGNVIRDAWKARQARREEEFNERGLLESFDVEDEKSPPAAG